MSGWNPDWETPDDWDPSEGLLTGQEVAALYRVTRTTVLLWTRSRKIPAIRLPGGDWRYSRKWVREDRARG